MHLFSTLFWQTTTLISVQPDETDVLVLVAVVVIYDEAIHYPRGRAEWDTLGKNVAVNSDLSFS